MIIKERLKGFIAGIIIATLMFSLVFATPVEQTIKILYNNIKIYVDGKLVSPKDANGNPVEPMIYNGTTYLPVRAVGQAIGKEVNWDGKTNSVYIGKYEGAGKESLYLFDMDYFNYQSSSDIMTFSGKWDNLNDKDNVGNSYLKGTTFYFAWSSASQYYEYLVNQKYTNIKGTFVLHHDDRSSNRQGCLKIYGDEKLIYTSPYMSAGVQPINFDVDITGVIKLKVEVESSGSSAESSEFGLVDTVLYQ